MAKYDPRFEPVPFKTVTDPQQLKAFTDPLRNRILHILSDRESTNQQLATSLGESGAKVLHHVRFLLDAGLIRLVDQRITGGNVEKYYRATARVYGFRPEPADAAALSGPVSGALFESVTQELIASLKLWPNQELTWETRRARLSPERLGEFNTRLLALLEEFWGSLGAEPPTANPEDELMAFATVTYRFPESNT